MPRSTSSARALAMSLTTRYVLRYEPGSACGMPVPNVIEHAEPVGVNWTTRIPGAGPVS
jgi:hypothetical protein